MPACSHMRGDVGHRLGRGLGRRGQDAPAVAEQFGEARFRPGMLGPGDRMAGNEMHAFRQRLAADRGSPPP